MWPLEVRIAELPHPRLGGILGFLILTLTTILERYERGHMGATGYATTHKTKLRRVMLFAMGKC